MTTPSRCHDDFLQALIAYVDANAGEKRFARYHAEVERKPGELRASSFRADVQGEDTTIFVRAADVVGDIDLDAALRRLVEATNDRAPIATIDFLLQKTGDTWMHRGLVHTIAERRALDADRAALDERLRSALARLPPPFGTVTLSWYRGAPLAFTGMFGPYDPEDIAPTTEILGLLEEYADFYAARGMELGHLAAVWRDSAPDALGLELTYGVPRDR
jgi:hypothetical protein